MRNNVRHRVIDKLHFCHCTKMILKWPTRTHIIKAIGYSQFCTDVIFGTKYNNISKVSGSRVESVIIYIQFKWLYVGN